MCLIDSANFKFGSMFMKMYYLPRFMSNQMLKFFMQIIEKPISDIAIGKKSYNRIFRIWTRQNYQTNLVVEHSSFLLLCNE